MSKFVIFVDDNTVPANVLMALQLALGCGLGDIQTAIVHDTPIFEREIFDGDYEKHTSTIRAIVQCLEDASVPSRIYELPEGEIMNSCLFLDNCRISVDVLNNILDRADSELDRHFGE